MAPGIAQPSPPPASGTPAKEFRVGTLIYTRAGLFTLFAWLLWGDFSLTLMEHVWPSVLPLSLQELNAPNTIISLFLTTIPGVMNFVLNPIISTMSDRFRSRWGRRVPFLLFATPFVALFLILLGFSKNIGGVLHGWFGQHEISWLTESTATIGVIGLLIVGFRFFELFVNTIYWYMFNDVVPQEVLGRFLGLCRLVGILAGASYNFFVYRYAQSHASDIFIGVGILYGVVFLLMCLNIKEGKYPPPPPEPSNSLFLGRIASFGRQCFGERIYVLIYLSSATWALSNCLNAFNVFMATSLGLTLLQVGQIQGGAALVGAALTYPAGILVDRFHPLRVMLAAKIGLCLVAPINMIYLFVDFAPDTVFWLYLLKTALTIPLAAIFTAASLPMLMRLLPKERYGQFCAANAMCAAAAGVLGGILGGVFLDTVKRFFEGNIYYYRFIPVWITCFLALSMICTILLFREWKRSPQN